MLREVLGKAKFQLLEHDVGYLMALGSLDALWMLTASSAPDGAIGRHLTDGEIEALLKWPGEPGKLIEALIERRWIDRIDGPSRLYVHDWHDHADYTVHRKIARAHGFFANGAAPKLGSFERKEEREAFREWYASNPSPTHEQPMGSPRVTHGLPESSPRDRLQGQIAGAGAGAGAEEEKERAARAAPPVADAELPAAPDLPVEPNGSSKRRKGKRKPPPPDSPLGGQAVSAWIDGMRERKRYDYRPEPKETKRLREIAEALGAIEDFRGSMLVYLAREDHQIKHYGHTVEGFGRCFRECHRLYLARKESDERIAKLREHDPPAEMPADSRAFGMQLLGQRNET